MNSQMLYETKQQKYKKEKACFYCHSALSFKEITLDHKVPKNKQGKNRYKNLVISCSKCNILKGSCFDYEHFAKIVKDTETRDNFWQIRQEIRLETVKENRNIIKQMWEYKTHCHKNNKNIEILKQNNLNFVKFENINKNIKKEIKNLKRKIHLLIEEKTKIEIKKAIKRNNNNYTHNFKLKGKINDEHINS